MSEITSVQTIRAKLNEFEERVTGAIDAANTLARIRTDAEKLIAHIQEIERKSERTETKIEKSLEKAEGVQFQFQQVQRDWEALKLAVDKAQGESKKIGDTLLSELASAVQFVDKKLVDAEERLKALNKSSLAGQADLLSRLEASTRANADVAAKAQTFVAETGGRLDGLLATVRDDLQTEVQDKLARAEKLLESQAQRVEKNLGQAQETLTNAVESKADNYHRLLREEMVTFKAEMNRNLAQHEQGIDRRLTDFLNKQNAMVQNLSQQIDSFNRVSQAQSTDLSLANRKLGEIAEAIRSNRESVTRDVAALTRGIGEVTTSLVNVETKIHSQDGAIAAFEKSSQGTAERLDQTLDKLKQLPLFLGGKFK